MKKKGFTLVELLVVIAIIGILATIVIVVTGGARDATRDARIQAQISQIRSVAELHYTDQNYTYDGLCTNTETVSLLTDIDTQSGESNACFASGDDYCISSPLASDSSSHICISPVGTIGDVLCEAANTVCQ